LTEVRTYHGQQILKNPVWTWEIPVYFFFGGTAGASAGLAYLSELRGNDVLARRAWGAAVTGIGISPVLLISDLGRPERFINMLRVFKVTSPMSVGSWILGASGTSIGIATVNAWTGLFPRLARLARPAAALFGLPLSTYTAALIANTAVPVWHEAHETLPFVFGSGAALSAGAAAVAATPTAHAAPARRLALGAAACELVASGLMERRLGEQGEPYEQGTAGKFAKISKVSIATGAALLFKRGGTSRPAAVAAGALLLAGAMSTRWSVLKAGAQSAADPKYVVGPQRAAIDRGERRGASRRHPRARDHGPATGSPATSS
jgi:formate-dependent nitrite reductase membrane component NrfD